MLIWFPGVLFVIGMALMLLSRNDRAKRIGKIGATVGCLSIIFSPFTIPASPSSAFGHFLGSMIGPLVLVFVGLYNLIFTGPSAVQQLPPLDRKIGVIMFCLGLLWMEAMHWWILTPTYHGEINEYWMTFWSTFLIGVFTISTASIVMSSSTEGNKNEAKPIMVVVAFMAFFFLIVGLFFDGIGVEKSMFQAYVFLSGLQLLGMILGAMIAFGSFVLVVLMFESRQPVLPSLATPNPSQLAHATSIIKQHLNGGEEDE